MITLKLVFQHCESLLYTETNKCYPISGINVLNQNLNLNLIQPVKGLQYTDIQTYKAKFKIHFAGFFCNNICLMRGLSILYHYLYFIILNSIIFFIQIIKCSDIAKLVTGSFHSSANSETSYIGSYFRFAISIISCFILKTKAYCSYICKWNITFIYELNKLKKKPTYVVLCGKSYVFKCFLAQDSRH